MKKQRNREAQTAGSILPVVVVHGGAGDVAKAKRPTHSEGCKRAAEEALALLLDGGSALDAAIRAVEILEDDPLFNAGTGGCLARDGSLELDASVMEGAAMRFGAVASLPPFKNPIRIAEAVLADATHTLYAGAGAAHFARTKGFEDAEPDSMITPTSRARLKKVLEGKADRGWAGGTVGAVVCDSHGRVAAATSTGGTVGKAPGRVGDTPIPGAGTFADDLAGACSATGIGEDIMRFGLARQACDLVRSGVPAKIAAEAAIAAFGTRVKGSGGLILVSPRGEAGVARNTETMSYAIARAGMGTEYGF